MSGPAAPDRVLLSYTLPDGTQGSVQLDASLSEQHSVTAQVTEHPVETGSNITDHIRPLPKKVSLSGLVTDTPIYTPSTQMSGVSGEITSISAQAGNDTLNYQALAFSDRFYRVRDVYGELVTAASQGALFNILTTLVFYDNMAITNFAVPRSVQNSNAIQFQIDFTQIRLVDTQTVAALPSSKKQAVKRSNKPTKAATDQQQQNTRTMAARVFDSAFGK